MLPFAYSLYLLFSTCPDINMPRHQHAHSSRLFSNVTYTAETHRVLVYMNVNLAKLNLKKLACTCAWVAYTYMHVFMHTCTQTHGVQIFRIVKTVFKLKSIYAIMHVYMCVHIHINIHVHMHVQNSHTHTSREYAYKLDSSCTYANDPAVLDLYVRSTHSCPRGLLSKCARTPLDTRVRFPTNTEIEMQIRTQTHTQTHAPGTR